MKITNFDDTYTQKLGLGETTLVSGSSGGSNSGLGGDVSGSLGNVSVDGLRRSVSLGSNLGTGVAIGDALTIVSTAGTPIARFATPSNTGASFGSNATRVSETSFVGALSTSAREDHRHDGIGTVTASSSNTMQRGTLNLRAGTNVSFGLTDTDGSGTVDTITVNASATGGSSGGGTLASGAYKRTSADYTTTSTSFVDVDTTNMNFTITTGAHRVLMGFVGTAEHSLANGNVVLDFMVDGTRVGGTFGLISPKFGANSTGAVRGNMSATYLTDILSAGSHTFKVQWCIIVAGTATMHGSSGDSESQFYVMEQGG